MKKYKIFDYIMISNLDKKIVNTFVIIIYFILNTIKNQIIESVPNFKLIYSYDNKYKGFIYDNICFYDYATFDFRYIYELKDEQKITTEEEAEMVSFGRYKKNTDAPNLFIIKDYFYAVLNEDNYCNNLINELDGYSSEIFPFKCIVTPKSYKGALLCF